MMQKTKINKALDNILDNIIEKDKVIKCIYLNDLIVEVSKRLPKILKKLPKGNEVTLFAAREIYPDYAKWWMVNNEDITFELYNKNWLGLTGLYLHYEFRGRKKVEVATYSPGISISESEYVKWSIESLVPVEIVKNIAYANHKKAIIFNDTIDSMSFIGGNTYKNIFADIKETLKNQKPEKISDIINSLGLGIDSQDFKKEVLENLSKLYSK